MANISSLQDEIQGSNPSVSTFETKKEILRNLKRFIFKDILFTILKELFMTRKGTGRIGLSMAINYFTIKGYTISLPINDT